MNEKTYEKLTNPIRKCSNGIKIIKAVDKTSTMLIYLMYPIFLLKLLFIKDVRFWKLLFIPGISFILVSIFRKYINIPRPYEVLDINPIISKDTKGKSFPSRHVFSAFVIATCIYYISKPIGIIIMAIGFIIAIIRVIGGVHFPKDVIAGSIIGILCGVLGWSLFIW